MWKSIKANKESNNIAQLSTVRVQESFWKKEIQFRIYIYIYHGTWNFYRLLDISMFHDEDEIENGSPRGCCRFISEFKT